MNEIGKGVLKLWSDQGKQGFIYIYKDFKRNRERKAKNVKVSFGRKILNTPLTTDRLFI